MICFKPFRYEDLQALRVQNQHKLAHETAISLGRRMQVVENAYAWTAWHERGYPLACCGIYWGDTWAFLSGDLKEHMIPITRMVRRVLDMYVAEGGSVYAEVDKSFKPAIRWVKLLGFEPRDDDLWIYSNIL